jgi:hypothetical protein
VSHRVEPGIHIRGRSFDMEPLTIRQRQSDRCRSPICGKPIEPIENGWRRRDRLYCDGCKMDAWVLKRAGELLRDVTDERVLEILRTPPRRWMRWLPRGHGDGANHGGAENTDSREPEVSDEEKA